VGYIVSITKKLRGLRKIREEEGLRPVAAWQNYDLVFPSEIGKPLNVPSIIKAFEKIRAKTNISKLNSLQFNYLDGIGISPPAPH
jgi:hypothetical protein